MGEYTFPLRDRREVAEGTMAFWFDSSGSDFTFKAGQNADFILINPSEPDPEGNARTFSFCSSPNEKGSIMVATRMRPTAFKNYLRAAPLGTHVKVTPAMGSFTLVNQEMLTRHVPEPDRAIYYLAGPPAMVAGMRQLLDSLGVSEDNLKTEEFAGY